MLNATDTVSGVVRSEQVDKLALLAPIPTAAPTPMTIGGERPISIIGDEDRKVSYWLEFMGFGTVYVRANRKAAG